MDLNRTRTRKDVSDTDLPPKSITVEQIERINSSLPEKIWDRENRYKEFGLPKDVIEPLSI